MATTRSLWRISALPVLVTVLLTLGFLVGHAAAADADNMVTFSNAGISAYGNGYEIAGTDLTITAAGTYTLTGSCDEGSITVKKEVTGVTLVLDDLTLTSSKTAPLTCNKTSQVTLQVTGNNTLTDSEDPSVEGVSDTYEGAGIKVKNGSDLTLIGDGALTINGTCNNGIKGASAATVTISGPTLHVFASNNAIASDGGVTVESGTLSLTAENDGLKAVPDEGDTESPGTVTIQDGAFTIATGGDGIQAAGAVTITGGDFQIVTGGGHTAALGDEDSAKGIKSDSTITITGGVFNMDSADDGIHAANVTLTGGSFTIDTGDDGVHADNTLVLGAQGSNVGPEMILGCYEGLEGSSVTLFSGSGHITTSDDGINAAGSEGSDNQIVVAIYGGEWRVDAGGDAIDSNGDVFFYGGVTEVYGSSTGRDAALDYDGSCAYEGGTLLAVGMHNMAQVPTSGTYVAFGASGLGGGRPQGGQGGGRGLNDGAPRQEEGQTLVHGEQPSGGEMKLITEQSETEQNADAASISIVQGIAISIQNSNGTVLYSATGVKSANHLVFCDTSLIAGETYTLYVDGIEIAEATAGVSMGPSSDTPAGNEQTPAEHTLPFRDVVGDAWYYDAVCFVQEQRLMSGTSADTFDPNASLTRAMVAQILFRLDGGVASQENSFSDVDAGAWYADAVNWAAANGLVNGYGQGMFGPEDAVSREQLAVLLYRYAENKDAASGDAAELNGYQDYDEVSAYARNAMAWACGAGVVTGASTTTLAPQSGATRAQTAALLMRFLELESAGG